MLLMTIQAWSKKYFVQGEAPSELTVRRWIQREILPGKKIGGTWYIDEHSWLANGDELILRVLATG